MLLTIHNSNLEKVAFIDNDKQDTLNYKSDKWVRRLDLASSTFEFVVSKRDIKSDTVKNKAYQTLTERSFVSFKYKNKNYLFNTVKIVENETEIRVFGENLNLELLNEKAPAFENDKAMSFVEYANHFGILNFGAITIGKNEIADRSRKIRWTGSDSKLKRLLSIARGFDAEIEFETRLNNNSSLKSFILNIYKKNDGKEVQGIGKRRDDVRLTYQKNIKNVTRTVDKSNIATMIFPVGKGKVTKTVVTTTTTSGSQSSSSKYDGGDLHYGGNTLTAQTVTEILKLSQQYNILPSGMICQLYLESWWGKSQVAKNDNNWGGFTWAGNPNRRSGVVVSQGTARPANEGGFYMHFASVSDYMKDYAYTLKNGGYNVSGKNNIDEYTKGLFRVGGSVYDYAAAGYAHYINLMRDIRNGINRNNNNVLDTLDTKPADTTHTTTQTHTVNIASQTKSALNDVRGLKGKHVGSGQCYALSAWYSNRLGGAGLGGGVTGFRGLIGAGMSAAEIGGDYNWKQFGWGVVIPSQIEHLIVGSIYNVKANYGSPYWTGVYGHTGVIIGNNGSTITVLEQNYNNHKYVEEHQYNASGFLGGIQTLCYPPEIMQGKRVDGTGQVSSSSTGSKTETNSESKDEDTIVYIDSNRTQEWKNEKGEVEFYLRGGALYAPLAAKLYPAVLTGRELSDNWLRLDIDVETTDENKLIEEAIQKLRQVAYPSITYDVNGSSDDLEIGDTVKIFDSGFNPTLTLQARVSEQTISFTNPSSNKTTFSNFRALENKVSSVLTDRLDEILEDLKPYELRLTTDNGLTFKNHTGRSVLRAELNKGNKVYEDATYQFKTGDTLLSAGLEYAVDGSSFDSQLPIVVSAFIGNDKVAEDTVIFTNISDGKQGADGRSQVLHVAYSNSSDGTVDFSILDSTNKSYLGQYSSFDLTPSSNPSDYKWTKFKGEDGQRGVDGLQGPRGADGIPGKPGADGKTQYTHIAYANSSDGTLAFSTSDSNRNYIGISVDFKKQDSTNPSDYTWTLIKGANGSQGLPGKAGADGRTPYFHVAYANSSDGSQGFSITDSQNKSYIGQYTDYNQADSMDRRSYRWTLIKGERGPQGERGIPGQKGADGKTQYTHIAYADDEHGNGFSQSSTNKKYIGLYQDFEAQDSNVASRYHWSKWQGRDGADGIPGKPGADGKTPYIHFAYSESADGRVGFSTSQTGNKRYIGTYTDYNQADSNDPTKYKWVDMVGTVEVGGRNLFLNSKFKFDLRRVYSTYRIYDDKSQTQGQLAIFIDTVNKHKGANSLKIISTFNGTESNQKITFSTGGDGRLGTADEMSGKSVMMSFWAKSTVANTVMQWRSGYRSATKRLSIGTSWKYYSFQLIAPQSGNATNEAILHILTAATVWIALPKVEIGTVSTDFSEAPEDIQSDIDSKADEGLTQEQLNALSERSSLIQTELQAKASLDIVNNFIKEYRDFVSAEQVGKAKAEKDLQTAAERLTLVQQNLGEYKARTDFIDSYMTSANEGLTIGKKDGSSSMLFSPNGRISMFSAGKEVMYIDKGVIHIDNGVFTKTLQIGRFKTMEYGANPDINVIRYVGNLT